MGVVNLNDKKKIVNEFINMCEIKIESEEKIGMTFQSTGVSICMFCIIEILYLYDCNTVIETAKGSISIDLKEYEVDILEAEGVLTLQFKNKNNEIRISI